MVSGFCRSSRFVNIGEQPRTPPFWTWLGYALGYEQ